MRLAATILALTAILQADTFRLGDGHAIKGKVLKETADAYFIDIGFTVIPVPKKAVLSREADAPAGAKADPKAAPSKEGLFSTVRRAEASVKANVARTEGAVVMIRTPSGLGSGFIISPDGYVVTNDHVIQGDTKITVVVFEKGADGTLAKRIIEKVKIVAMNAYWDLALLKMEGVENLPIAYLGDSDDVRVGQSCYAIGNPHGLERTVSEGIVSTLNRVVGGETHIQTTTPINPGNSGGPLFNLKGEVIGVVDLKATAAEGLNFAIPVTRVRRFLRDREAFAYDKDNPNTGYRYMPPPAKKPATKE
jgi:serine protease Do